MPRFAVPEVAAFIKERQQQAGERSGFPACSYTSAGTGPFPSRQMVSGPFTFRDWPLLTQDPTFDLEHMRRAGI